MKNNKSIKKVIGYCPVDSGQIFIIDPCYLSEWKDGEAYPEKPDGNHYSKCCEVTNNKDSGGEVLVSAVAGKGVAVSSGLGDGLYPVIATYDKDGIVKKIEVKFM